MNAPVPVLYGPRGRRSPPGRAGWRAGATGRFSVRGSQRVSLRPSSSTAVEVSQPSSPMVAMPTKTPG